MAADNLNTGLLVVGGGLSGSAMALPAARAGIDCVLVEKNAAPPAAPDQDPRILALSPASRRILDAVQAWRAPAGRFQRMQVWDEMGRGRLNFAAADIDQPALGYTIPQGLLEDALATARDAAPTITTLTGATPTRLRRDDKTIRATLNDGRCVTARLLVAADGAGSAARRLAGIEYDARPYQQTAVAGVVRTALPHEQTARQRFLRTGPLAFLPLEDPHQCGFVWSTAPGAARRLLALSDADFRQRLAAAFEHRLGDIVAVSSRRGFDLQRAQARRYCAPRTALLGDAAHCVHPLAGLGANLGLLDAACLAQVLSAAHRQQRDYGAMAVLRKYERWRRGENFVAMMTLDRLKWFFETQAPPLPWVRNAGMELFDALQVLKNLTMRLAMGLAGDLPDIVKNG